MESGFVLVDHEREKRGGRPKGDHWEHFERTEVTNDGHAKATCKFCGDSWYRGEKVILVGHIANHCKAAPPNIIREYLGKMNESPGASTNKKRRSNSNLANTEVTGQTLLTQSYNKIENLNPGYINRLNRALLKFFVCCGISFQVVENPFFIDFTKELNPSYNLPSRELLSGRFLEEELAKVNNNIENELKNERNLTLGKFYFISKFK